MSQKVFENNFAAVRKSKVTLIHYKSAYVEMCLLNLSKVLICQFHYNCNKYGKNSWLLFTETDSLMYEIKTEDLYEDFSTYKEMFNFSN